ncbi:MAG: hypothetical protein WBP38_13610 [Hyphomicrobium sp.]|nr:hypothetical protein [Hyphomicrobium sp.]
MRQQAVVTFMLLFMLIAGLPGGSALAGGGVECITSQCEAKGRPCVETLYATYAACMKAGNAKCAGAKAMEKFKCLTSELHPCASTRTKDEEACLAEFKSCYATCGPLEGKRADYWCMATFGDTATAGFCAADPSSSKQMDQCAKVFTRKGDFEATMSCQQL